MKTNFIFILSLFFFTLTSGQTFTLTKKYKKTTGIFQSLGIIKSELTNNTNKEAYDLFYETLLSAILRNPSLPKLRIMNVAQNTFSKRDSVKISRKNYFTVSIPDTINFCSDDYCPDAMLIFKTYRIKVKNVSSATLNPKTHYTYLLSYFLWDNRNGEIAGYGTIENTFERNRDNDVTKDYESIAERFSAQIVSDMKILEK